MSSPTWGPDGVFSPDEIEALERDSIFQPGIPIKGKRKVSTALLSPPESVAASISSSSSAGSSVSVRFSPDTRPVSGSFELPTAPISVEALEFIGFTTPAATTIYNNYVSRPSPQINRYDLLDHAYGHISQINTPAYQAMSLSQALGAVGIDSITQTVLLDPRFSRIFWTYDLYYWLRDTLKLRYMSLLHLQDRLKAHATLRRGGKKQKRASLQGVFPSVPTSIQQYPEVTATLNMMSKTHFLPADHVTIMTEEPDDNLLGHTTLYKGKAVSEMIEEGPWVLEDGSLDMGVLSTLPGGDFNSLSLAHYWTCDKGVAMDYQAWAARRAPWSETWLIRIQVPNVFLSSLVIKELWYSPDWKEYVWYCKRKRLPPAKFDYLFREPPIGPDLIRGHICTGVDTPIKRIKQQDVQTRITEDNVMRQGNGQKAKQWAFVSADSLVRLGDQIRGKVHIAIFEPLSDK